MIKRLGKAKKRKQGAILIFVVLILALAMIFIASAMMLTQSTRTRLYERTMSSQARLTVTSAAEIFLEALETQEITDDQLDSVIKTYHGSDKIRMEVPGVPGMSSSADNCTVLDIYYPDSSHKLVNCDFTTTIGDETESVRIVLNSDESGPNYGNRFKNQIEVNANVLTETMRFYRGVGMWDPSMSKPTDNTILLRGSGTDSGGGGYFYSDVVFAPDQESHWGSSNHFMGNVVFLKNAKFYSSHNDVKYSGDLYFIGDSPDDAAFLYKGGDAANQYNINNFSNSKFVFLNRSVQRSSLDDRKDDGEHIEKVVKGLNDSNTVVSSKSCYFVTYDSDAAAMNDEENPRRIVFKATTAGSNNTRQHTNSSTTYNVDNAWASTIDYTSVSADMVEVNDNLKIYSASDYCNVNKAFPSDVSSVFSDFSPDGYETAPAAGVTLSYDTYTKDGTPIAKNTLIPAGTEYEATPLTKTFPSWLRANGAEDGAIPSTNTFALTKSNLDSTASQQGHSGYVYLAPKYYYFTADTNEIGYQDSNNAKPYVIAIDGSHASSYRFYFQGNTVFNLGAVVFAVYNVTDQTTPIVFILEDGAKIYFGGANYRGVSSICNSGIISVLHVDENGDACYSDAATMASYIRGTSYTDEISDWGGGYVGKNGNDSVTVEYPYCYDSVRRPTAYVFGTGNNVMRIGDRCTLEGYIGLYGSGSTFGFNNCNDEGLPIYIYGRLETDNYGIQNYTGAPGGLCMPYCPQPGGVTAGEKQTGRARSKYSVADLQFYRNLPA